jgi:hypothetical protein
MSQQAKQAAVKCSIPDGFMYSPATSTDRARYTIVEFKFCRDTDPRSQAAWATSQHSTLMQALKDADPMAIVTMEIILVGVSGAVYNEYTKDPLVRLGVTPGAWDRLRYGMHMAAVQQLHWIYTNKLMQESKVNPGMHGKRSYTRPLMAGCGVVTSAVLDSKWCLH